MTHQTSSGNTWSTQVDASGAFARRPTTFRGAVSAASQTLQPEAGRYHLYVSLACPWAHRTLIARAVKGLEAAISVDVVHPHLTERGWSFETDFPGTTGDSMGGRSMLRERYLESDAAFEGVVTVPVLWDRKLGSIVNNESGDILRMFNAEFQAFAKNPAIDLYPLALREQIDALNAWIYSDINDGVYRAGFARSQSAHDAAVSRLFGGLERVESLLERQRYLCGDVFTEADIRLFVTLIRFDPVYHTHFKCNRRSMLQSPGLLRYMADIYRLPGVAATVNLDHVRHHYYGSHKHINPSGLIPQGPDVLAALASVEMDSARRADHGRGIT